MKISTRQFIANQTSWTKELQLYKDLLLSAEAKLREAGISKESALRETEILALREAIKVFNINLTEYKAAANEWRGQLKDERQDYTKVTEHEKDIQSVRQAIGELGKNLNDKIDPILTFVQRSQGGNKVWFILISIFSGLFGAGLVAVIHYLNSSK